MTIMQQPGPEAAHKLVDFLNASPTPFHAVQAATARLEKAGFVKVQGAEEELRDFSNVLLGQGAG